MRIIIFGGGGFIGIKLTQALLKQGEIALNGQPAQPITQLVVFDKYLPETIIDDPRVQVIEGDIRDEKTIRNLLKPPVDAIFHLAAIVSGEAEKNFDLGMGVNLHATLQMLEICREYGQKPVFVFAGSCASFGGDYADHIYDYTTPAPQSSYGTQKTICDLLVNDYSRRGFIDGRVLRLPTIAVRPGKPNAATTTFVSSIIREPLQGERATCPVSRDVEVWILSPKRVTEHFIHAAALPAAAWGKSRIVNLPGLTTTIGEMVEHLERIGGKEAADRIDWVPDDFIQGIVLTFPTQFSPERALKMGFVADASAGEIIEAFVAEDMVKE